MDYEPKRALPQTREATAYIRIGCSSVSAGVWGVQPPPAASDGQHRPPGVRGVGDCHLHAGGLELREGTEITGVTVVDLNADVGSIDHDPAGASRR